MEKLIAQEENILQKAQFRADSFQLQLDQLVLDEQKKLMRIKQLRFIEKQDYLKHRNAWAITLLILMIVIVLLTIFLLVCVGMGWLEFEDEWLVRVIFAGSMLEVLALAKIVVDFLFKEPPN